MEVELAVEAAAGEEYGRDDEEDDGEELGGEGAGGGPQAALLGVGEEGSPVVGCATVVSALMERWWCRPPRVKR